MEEAADCWPPPPPPALRSRVLPGGKDPSSGRRGSGPLCSSSEEDYSPSAALNQSAAVARQATQAPFSPPLPDLWMAGSAAAGEEAGSATGPQQGVQEAWCWAGQEQSWAAPPEDAGRGRWSGAEALPPLAERVERSRMMVRQMLDVPPGPSAWMDTGSIPMNDSERDSGISLQDNDQNHRQDFPLSQRHVQAQTLLQKARMKARCAPLRGDHNLLLQHGGRAVTKPGSGSLQRDALSGTLSDSSSSDSGFAPPQRRPGLSPTRVRFEDETEREAERRYLERETLRRRRGAGLLLAKPILPAYACRQVRCPLVGRQCNACGSVLGRGVPPGEEEGGAGPYWAAPTPPHLTLRTQRLRETYIGGVAHDNSTALVGGARDWGGGARGTNCHVPSITARMTTNQVQLTGVNDHPRPLPPDVVQGTLTPQTTATGTLDLPPNPYAPEQIAPPTHPPPVCIAPSADNSSRQATLMLRGRTKGRGGRSLDPPGEQHTAVDTRSRTTANSDGDGRVRGPIRAEHQGDRSPGQPELDSLEGAPSKLSLRGIFSAMRLSGTGAARRRPRSSSLDHLQGHSARGPDSPGLRRSPGAPSPPAPSGLRKAPSLQCLSMGSPFPRLKKSSSVQSFSSTQKSDRSAAYSPAHQPTSPALCRALQRTLSVEDVGVPSQVRSVGRVSQVFPDGSLLLELQRPPNGPYGFHISRSRGRRDSGVYVEDMMDGSTEKLYAGLLGPGDEVLEVEGEKVSGLSLDLVTRLLTQNSSCSVRVLPHRRPPQR